MNNILKTFQKHNWLKFAFYTASIFLFVYISNFLFKNTWYSGEITGVEIIYSVYNIPALIGVSLMSLGVCHRMKEGDFLKKNEQWRILKKPFLLTLLSSALFVLIFNYIPLLVFDPESGFTFGLYNFSVIYITIAAQYLTYILKSWGVVIFVPLVMSVIFFLLQILAYEYIGDPKWMIIPILVILWTYSYQVFKYYKSRDILRQLYVLSFSGFMTASFTFFFSDWKVWGVIGVVMTPYLLFVVHDLVKKFSWEKSIQLWNRARIAQVSSLIVIAILTVLIAYLPIFHSSVTFRYESVLPQFGYVVVLFILLPFAILSLIQLFTKDANSQKLEGLVSLKAFGSYLIVAFVVITTLLNTWETQTLIEVRGIVADKVEEYYDVNEVYPRSLQDIAFENTTPYQKKVIRQQFHYGSSKAFSSEDPFSLYYLRKFPSFYEKIGYSPLYKEWRESPF